MTLTIDVEKDSDRGVYVYYVLHDGAKITLSERKFGNVDKRRKAAAEAAARQQQTPPPAEG